MSAKDPAFVRRRFIQFCRLTFAKLQELRDEAPATDVVTAMASIQDKAEDVAVLSCTGGDHPAALFENLASVAAETFAASQALIFPRLSDEAIEALIQQVVEENSGEATA